MTAAPRSGRLRRAPVVTEGGGASARHGLRALTANTITERRRTSDRTRGRPGLPGPLHDVVRQRGEEREVGAVVRSGERRRQPLLCSLGQSVSSVAGPFHASAVVQDALDLDDLTGQSALPATPDEVLQHGSFGGAGTGKGVDEWQGALALVEVAVDLLAVHRLVAGDVEQVVVDLERRAEQ